MFLKTFATQIYQTLVKTSRSDVVLFTITDFIIPEYQWSSTKVLVSGFASLSKLAMVTSTGFPEFDESRHLVSK